MSNDRDSAFFASAVLVTRADALPKIRARLAPVTDSGTAVVTIRDPEHRARLDLRMMPGVPSASDETIKQYLAQMERSTLVNATTAQRLLKIISILKGMVRPERDYYRSTGISADFDLKGTLSDCMSEGDIFAAINVQGTDGSIPEALLAIQGGVWLSSISCDVNYRSGRHGFGDSWNLGRIEHGSIDRVRERLNEMADRRKISSDRAAYVDDWIKLLAERTEALPTIKITRQ